MFRDDLFKTIIEELGDSDFIFIEMSDDGAFVNSSINNQSDVIDVLAELVSRMIDNEDRELEEKKLIH